MFGLEISFRKSLREPWDEAAALAEERGKFSEAGLDYDAALERLNQALSLLGHSAYAESDGMASSHWILFAALSLKQKMGRILEIGTYDGGTARLLAELFPDAHITSVDLPHDDPRFSGNYDRASEEVRQSHLERQERNTASPQIDLLLVDSVLLPGRVDPGFDLIWVDGGHLYPAVAWDLANAYHLCADSGWILCDDVLTHPGADSFAAVNRDAYEVIEYLRDRGLVEVRLFLKRVGTLWCENPRRRKSVAVLRKLPAA